MPEAALSPVRFGPNHHPIFIKNTQAGKSASWLNRVRQKYRSQGAIHYYIFDPHSRMRTRVHIHNYFALLADYPISAAWQISVYDRQGRRCKVLKGSLVGPQTQTIEIGPELEPDIYGILFVHLIPDPVVALFPRPFQTVFFTEHYIPQTDISIMAHSLGHPTADHHAYKRIASGWVTPAGFRPYLMVANSCTFHPWGHGQCGYGCITFINHRYERRSILIDPLKPLAARKIDIFEADPGLREHLGDLPYTIEIEGQNVLSKPYMIQTDGKRFLSEHL